MAGFRDGGRAVVSCSWCHTDVDAYPGRTYCRRCGHRADVARCDCDCPKCWKPDDGVADAQAEGRQ